MKRFFLSFALILGHKLAITVIALGEPENRRSKYVIYNFVGGWGGSVGPLLGQSLKKTYEGFVNRFKDPLNLNNLFFWKKVP